MKKLILGILYMLIISELSIAEEKYIQLEGNSYQMENICYNDYEISSKYKSFSRNYKFTFNSKYNVFENYENVRALVFKTDLYTFNAFSSISSLSNNAPEILQNKKTIEVYLDEENMQKLYKSNSAKVIFDSSIFAFEYTRDKFTRLIFPTLIPVVSISLDKNDFDKELKKCNEKYNKYSQEYDEYHSKPLNRIKTFFNLK